MKQTVLARVSFGWWRWPLVGFFVAVTFLAHDVAMARNAHSDHSVASHGSQAHVHLPVVSATPHHSNFPSVGKDDSCLSTFCVPPTACDIGQTLVRPAVGEGGGLDPPSLIRFSVSLPEHPPTGLRASTGDGPTLPPAVRRALLQVFLI